jgi:hypothetical protein
MQHFFLNRMYLPTVCCGTLLNNCCTGNIVAGAMPWFGGVGHGAAAAARALKAQACKRWLSSCVVQRSTLGGKMMRYLTGTAFQLFS